MKIKMSTSIFDQEFTSQSAIDDVLAALALELSLADYNSGLKPDLGKSSDEAWGMIVEAYANIDTATVERQGIAISIYS